MIPLLCFIAGVFYTLAGTFTCILVMDMRGSRLNALIGRSVSLTMLAVSLWPLVLPFAAGHARWRTKRNKQVL